MRASAETGSLYCPTTVDDVAATVAVPLPIAALACWTMSGERTVVIVPVAVALAVYWTPIVIVPLTAVRNGPPPLPVAR